MRMVTVVNRSAGNVERTLRGTWDGRQYDITPGKHQFPEHQAWAFRKQNPVMGSEDPMSGKMDYWIGIEENGDPIDPITVTPETKFGERWNRELDPYLRERAESRPGLATIYRQGKAAPLPSNVNFVEP